MGSEVIERTMREEAEKSIALMEEATLWADRNCQRVEATFQRIVDANSDIERQQARGVVGLTKPYEDRIVEACAQEVLYWKVIVSSLSQHSKLVRSTMSLMAEGSKPMTGGSKP